MKRFYYFAIAVCLSAGACTKSEPVMQAVDAELDFEVTLPSDSVKTSLGGKTGTRYQTVWNKGDVISLNGIISQPLSSEKAGTSKAPFRFKGSMSAPYNFLYPGTNKSDEVVLPAVQTYCPGTFDASSMPMYASSTSFEDVTMSHLCSILAMSFTSSSDIDMKNIYLTSLGGEPLSGSFKMETGPNGLFTGEMTPIEVSSSVTLDLTGVKLGSAAKEFIICIPAGDYSAGFLALIVASDGKAQQVNFYTTGGTHSIQASKLIRFPQKEFKPSGTTMLIDDAQDLELYAQNPAQYSQAVLLSDIDMNGHSWSSIPDISGVFNGGGHKISGLTSSFAASVSGLIKNLVIEVDGADYPLFAGDISGTLKNCVAEGKVIGSSSSVIGAFAATASGSFDGCRCNADVEVTVAEGNTVCAGGFVGRYTGAFPCNASGDGKVTFKAEGNTGEASIGGFAGALAPTDSVIQSLTGDIPVDVIYQSGAKSGNVSVGGLAGSVQSSCELKKCSYSGIVTVSGSVLRNTDDLLLRNVFGSIAGSVVSDGKIILNECSASGDITFNGEGSSLVAAGGLVGEIDANETEFKNCLSSCAITLNGGSASNFHIGGIAATAWRAEAMKVSFDGCVNSGNLSVRDGANQSGFRMTAGGILACAASNSAAQKLDLSIKNCHNHGQIDRALDYSATYKGNYSSFAGGIIGACGVCHMLSESYSYSDIKVENCSNDARIRFNLYISDSSFIEKITSYSFCGGIIGLSRGAGGSVLVKCCENNGAILPNAGYAGGIVGFIHSSTVVRGEKVSSGVINYTKNSGNVGEYDFEKKNPTGSGYLISGGIVGYLKNGDDNSLVEYCWNAGKIAGSKANKTRPFPGGIVGYVTLNKAINCCKNSGYVRCYGSYTYQSGLITGSAATVVVSNCGVGGHIWRDAWVEPTANESGEGKPFTNYIYGCWNMGSAIEKYPKAEYYPGCSYWDGTSLLEWEK